MWFEGDNKCDANQGETIENRKVKKILHKLEKKNLPKISGESSAVGPEQEW